jgi:hypothetical protein
MKALAITLAAAASTLLVTAASAAPLSANVSVAPESNIQTVRMVCMKTVAAGANVVNAVLSSATGATLTDMPLASAISSGAAMKTVAVSASALPA